MVFQILCQLHMCENSRFRSITQLRLVTEHGILLWWKAGPSPRGRFSRKFHMTQVILPHQRWLCVATRWSSIQVNSGQWSFLSRAWQIMLRALRLLQATVVLYGLSLPVCGKLYFSVLACSLLGLCFGGASIILSEACVWKESNSADFAQATLSAPMSWCHMPSALPC